MSATTATDRQALEAVSRQIRRWILRSTSAADSGHPTSSLSAVELMATLLFDGHFRFDVQRIDDPANDRLIFSKGHASPLFYALWAAAGQIGEDELMSYRQFGSDLEGHPTSRFAFTEAATGSLGQGLSVGLGMAMAARYHQPSPSRCFVLLGDSEMAEGSQWEAIQLAAHYKLDNLIGIIDVNRLGQRGETMYGHDPEEYCRRIEPFGWRCVMIEDGHDQRQVSAAFARALDPKAADGRPVMIVAKTVKGKGVEFLENENGFHGKPVDEDRLEKALADLGEPAKPLSVEIAPPDRSDTRVPESDSASSAEVESVQYALGDQVATRDAFGNALRRLAAEHRELVVLDGEVGNSTRTKFFREAFPNRFYQMFIAEQNMVGAATGMALRGATPFVTTFAAFLTRAFDQIRMIPYSNANVKFAGSHCGVAIGQDGPSQMGLEDIAMFRTIQNGLVLYPSDAVSAEALVDAMVEHQGVAYLRTSRGKSPVIYERSETFPVGGSKLLRHSDDDKVTLVAAGVTLHEALKAHELLGKDGLKARVIDLYSIKPLDHATLRRAADETEVVFTLEDHFPEGGLGEAVLTSLSDHATPVNCLAVRERPLSGAPERQLAAQGLSAAKIARSVRHWCGTE